MACSLRTVDHGFPRASVGVNEPNCDCKKILLWEELASLGSWCDVLWVIGEDFNITSFPNKRLGNVIYVSLWRHSLILVFIKDLWILSWWSFYTVLQTGFNVFSKN